MVKGLRTHVRLITVTKLAWWPVNHMNYKCSNHDGVIFNGLRVVEGWCGGKIYIFFIHSALVLSENRGQCRDFS